MEVLTAEAMLDKLVYIATNPVKDGLVEKVHHWPGPNFVKALLASKPMKATRPLHCFRKDGPMPAELELKLPDHFEGKEPFLAELRRRITAVEEACAAERQRTGRQVIGRRRILRQSTPRTQLTRSCPAAFAPRSACAPPARAVAAWSARIRLLLAHASRSSPRAHDHRFRPPCAKPIPGRFQGTCCARSASPNRTSP